jgi:serine protease Do
MGKVIRGRLDVTVQEVTNEIAEGLGLQTGTQGVLVAKVLHGGAADKAGVKSGDVIVEFSGKQVKNVRKLQVMVAEVKVNTLVPMKVIRNGKTLKIEVKITDNDTAEESTDKSAAASKIPSKSFEKNGVTFSNLTEELKSRYGIEQDIQGVIVTGVKNNKNHGLKVGDLVLVINQNHMNVVDDLIKIFDIASKAGKRNVVMLVRRRGIDIFTAFPVE